MLSSTKQAKTTKKEKSKNNLDQKSNKTWRAGDWTLRAYLEPRGNRVSFMKHQSEKKSVRLEDHLPDPNRVMYFDLERTSFDQKEQSRLIKSHERDHHIPGIQIFLNSIQVEED